jgi:hypothetical protein
MVVGDAWFERVEDRAEAEAARTDAPSLVTG